MKYKDKYCYPAILRYTETNNVEVRFPDIEDCFCCGTGLTTEDIFNMARKVLGFRLYELEQLRLPLPTPSDVNSVRKDVGVVLVLIECYMPKVREAIENKTIKTTVTMPQWLKTLASENNLNFSQLLQDAIKEKLNL
jgi:predicted RNase H-like HicB family nuclease